MVGLARTVLDVFYRRMEVVGVDQVPEDGGVVYVGNHVSSLLDPALLLAAMPRPPRFLAKSTLWDMPSLRPFLRWAAAIPVYRRHDPGVDPSQNARTFDRCHEVLAAGGAMALFPEGISHNEPGLVPLKTGVSRIVLEALGRFPESRIRIVPVGLTFDDKTRFRSRVLVRVGEPLDPTAEAEPYLAIEADERRSGENEEARVLVRRLTERIREGLEAVTLNYPSWDEARLIERAAAIYARPSLEAPAEEKLAESFPLRRLFIEGYSELLEKVPDEVHRVAAEVRAYDQALALYDLDDAQVASEYPPSTVLRFTLRSLFLVLVRMPLGAVGTVLNYLPYRLAGVMARRWSTGPDTDSTYKVFPSLISYPINWLLMAALVGLGVRWGLDAPPLAAILAGLGALVLGPLSGLSAIRFHQRLDLFLDQARAFLLLRTGRRGVVRLREQRQRVLDAIEGLVRTYLGGDADPGRSHP